jgi:hypothetical protein
MQLRRKSASWGGREMGESIAARERLPLIEPDHVPEFFVTHLADFQIVGGLIRIALSCERRLMTQITYAPFVAHSSIVRVRLVMPVGRRCEMRREVDDLIEEYRGLAPH